MKNPTVKNVHCYPYWDTKKEREQVKKKIEEAKKKQEEKK